MASRRRARQDRNATTGRRAMARGARFHHTGKPQQRCGIVCRAAGFRHSQPCGESCSFLEIKDDSLYEWNLATANCRQRRALMNQLVGEILGTMTLILLGDGVVAGVLLNKSKAQ